MSIRAYNISKSLTIWSMRIPLNLTFQTENFSIDPVHDLFSKKMLPYSKLVLSSAASSLIHNWEKVCGHILIVTLMSQCLWLMRSLRLVEVEFYFLKGEAPVIKVCVLYVPTEMPGEDNALRTKRQHGAAGRAMSWRPLCKKGKEKISKTQVNEKDDDDDQSISVCVCVRSSFHPSFLSHQSPLHISGWAFVCVCVWSCAWGCCQPKSLQCYITTSVFNLYLKTGLSTDNKVTDAK